MPTPSPEQPTDPSSPQQHGFLQCPDDLQFTQRSSWQPDGPALDGNEESDAETRDERLLRIVDGTIGGRSPAVGIARVEETFSVDQSSRATTMSPRPQSSATAGTSPMANSSDAGMKTGTDSAIGGDMADKLARPADATRDVRPSDHRRPESPTPEQPGFEEDEELYSPYMGSDFPATRSKPSPASSFLRPGSRFHGTQQSEKQVYEVQVEMKHVDMRESFLCGYLRIQGLTEDHPTLTTYFEGEIIGSQYSFFTQHEDWGANHKVDLSHWSKFNAFRPYQKQARRGPVTINDVSQKENIFMRWKEHFLVPDHRVKTITGASFEGFYYICFNQIKGEVSGIYFHSKSEKFQQLELKHVPDRGCFSATEFR
jgi:hypothetical protein